MVTLRFLEERLQPVVQLHAAARDLARAPHHGPPVHGELLNPEHFLAGRVSKSVNLSGGRPEASAALRPLMGPIVSTATVSPSSSPLTSEPAGLLSPRCVHSNRRKSPFFGHNFVRLIGTPVCFARRG